MRTVYNLMQWWNCTPVFDNGAGTTAAYLSWATEQLCTGTEYYAILIANFVVVAFYAVGLPLRVIALLYPYRYRLGEEAVLMRHGWLYQVDKPTWRLLSLFQQLCLRAACEAMAAPLFHDRSWRARRQLP